MIEEQTLNEQAAYAETQESDIDLSRFTTTEYELDKWDIEYQNHWILEGEGDAEFSQEYFDLKAELLFRRRVWEAEDRQKGGWGLRPQGGVPYGWVDSRTIPPEKAPAVIAEDDVRAMRQELAAQKRTTRLKSSLKDLSN